MIDQLTKKAYIQTLKDTGSDHPIISVAERFLQNYEGDDKEIVGLLFLGLTGMLIKYEEYKIKAHGYDEIMEVQEGLNGAMEEIKESFDNIQKGKLPPQPAASLN